MKVKHLWTKKTFWFEVSRSLHLSYNIFAWGHSVYRRTQMLITHVLSAGCLSCSQPLLWFFLIPSHTMPCHILSPYRSFYTVRDWHILPTSTRIRKLFHKVFPFLKNFTWKMTTCKFCMICRQSSILHYICCKGQLRISNLVNVWRMLGA